MPTLADQNAASMAVEVDAFSSESNDEVIVERLNDAFGQSFAVIDIQHVVLDGAPEDWLPIDLFRWLQLCEQVTANGQPEILDEHSPLMLLAYPLPDSYGTCRRVAVSTLLIDRIESLDQIESAAKVFGVEPERAMEWSRGKTVWPPRGALKLIEALHEKWTLSKKTNNQQEQITDITSNLLTTFDELNMLHRLTGRITLGQSARELCDQSIQWLSEVIPAQCIVARWEWTNQSGAKAGFEREPKMLSFIQGPLPIDESELDSLFEGLGSEARHCSLTLNHDRTSSPTWNHPSITELVTAPILANDRFLGWIGLMNRKDTRRGQERDFGVVESSLLSSVAAILGVHAGNRRLFRLQTELFNGSIRAMTAAIDAKDPYTRGHSDRVARISVRLAKQLGMSEEDLDTIYLGGLLHDIGKIGISDAILSKPDQLSDEEFEHIKTHPQRGKEILEGVPQLSHLLPIVLHHHEAWDGAGYPNGMVGIECPKLARVVAVADAIDAMGGDRVYRKGLPIEKVESILRDGAGKQWDPDVIDAYFIVRDDIATIQDESKSNNNDAFRRPKAGASLAWNL